MRHGAKQGEIYEIKALPTPSVSRFFANGICGRTVHLIKLDAQHF